MAIYQWLAPMVGEFVWKMAIIESAPLFHYWKATDSETESVEPHRAPLKVTS